MDAALEAIGETGPSGWSLRELARRAGVSHAAPAHHFGDKAGLLTAVAAEGYAALSDELERADGDFGEVGAAYVRFAVTRPAYWTVMFRPELYRADDPAVAAARARSRAVLVSGARGAAGRPERERLVMLAAWSLAHGFAGLWLDGALAESAEDGRDPAELARAVFRTAAEGFGSPGD
ncbi:TetR/AcrR family transcriptional regulator [Streptomyces avicenniae]|uniref:TetR/AcrR family transcriptional regulator n=1 Tax=Streptomyces avicenniae TaxID=500153 RepID=UPI0006999CCC|nr:TetR/AcrR family transcriptional regulator [Streptomyces avicenniae]